ncbi:MAG: TIGR00341 family protein [Lysobacterales bacterium]
MYRLIEVLAPLAARDRLIRALEDTDVIARWPVLEGEEKVCARLLVQVQSSGDWVDAIESALTGIEDYRLVLLPVEASIPREPKPDPVEAESEAPRRNGGISRDELIDELQDGISLGFDYLSFVLVSVLVAIVGLVQDNIAVIVGAMVLAPLLTPNVAVALATTLGDFKLARQALKAGTLGAGLALLVAMAVSYCLDLSLDSHELLVRTEIRVGDVLVALAAGAAGVLALTGGASSSLIGVMVAVALMPPLVAAGLFAGAGQWQHAYAAGSLFAVNLLAVNLAGVLTFLVRGIRPRGWWQAARAERSAWIAVSIWALLLLALLLLLNATGVMTLWDA